LDRQTGALSRIIERGARAIDMLLTMVALRTLPAMLQFVFVCGILWYLYGWTYAFVTFVGTFSYVYYTFMVTDWRVKFRREMNASDGEAHAKLVDTLINYETVKYFGNEANEYCRLDKSWGDYENAAVRSKSSLALLNTGQGVIIAIATAAILLLAAYDIRAGTMTVGDLIAVYMWLTQLFIPLNFLGMLYREVKQAVVDLELVFALVDQEPEILDRPGAKSLEQVEGRITFDNVEFAYKSDRPILNGLTFTAAPGERVAIVGSTGAGKSTIVRLLFRFFDVTGGTINIDGQNISDLKQVSLRNIIGIVPQDTVLFNDNIRYNVAYGRLDAKEADLQDAIERAQLSSFVKKLSDGLKTQVGERGLKLSGGEKQRVGIARAILKQPKILIFDEATSSLDMVTEKEILSAMREASQGRTTIIIAHRLSTITDSDKILVLDEGRVVETGTHRELLARHGLYSKLWEAQKREQDESASKLEPVLEAVLAE
jgi:ATP-binding cassette subfamily B protein